MLLLIDLFVASLLLFKLSSAQTNSQYSYVRISNGTLRGDKWNQYCTSFLGIPYAKPPVQQLRFMPPVSHDGWPGVLLADHFGPSCLQKVGSGKLMDSLAPVSEDCLYLNIFGPPIMQNSAGYPVMIWVHGGGFYYGNGGSLKPEDVCDRMVNEGVLVVTLNYRLGPFGFLSVCDESSLSNIALYDQLKAVQWVHENIGNFGGDPTNIFLVGHGSGAATVGLVTMCSLSQGLIRGSIQMSGSVLSPWAVTSHSVSSTKQLVKKLNCQCNQTNYSIADCMRNQSAIDILNEAPSLWSPVIDKTCPFLADAPLNLIRRNPQKIPTIIGINKDEAAFLIFEKLANFSKTERQFSIGELTDYFLSDFIKNFLHTKGAYLKEVLFEEYFDENNFANNIFEEAAGAIELYTDFLYRSPVIHEAVYRAGSGSRNTYLYQFEIPTSIPLGNTVQWSGAPHGIDLVHLWGPSALKAFDSYYQLQNKNSPILAKLWANFFYGNMNRPGIDSLLTVDWAPFTAQEPYLFEIGTTQRLTMLNYQSKLKLWTQTVPQILSGSVQNPVTNLSTQSPTGVIQKLLSTSNYPNRMQLPNTANTANVTLGQSTTNPRFGWPLYSTGSVLPPYTGYATSTINLKQSYNSTVPPIHVDAQTRTVLWVMVALALLFFIMFLVTAGVCAAYNRQTFYPQFSAMARYRQSPPHQISGPASIPQIFRSPGHTRRPPPPPPIPHRPLGYTITTNCRRC